jgi:hypothetical protein
MLVYTEFGHAPLQLLPWKEVTVDTELWGTFSVNDHGRRRAFVADVLLYDRVVIPVPDGGAEWERWTRRGRDPKRQQALLKILDTHAVRIPWTLEWHEEWARQYDEAVALEKDGLALGGARAKVANAVETEAERLNQARAQLAAQERPEDLAALAQVVTREVLVSAQGIGGEDDRRLLAGLPKVEVESVPAFGSMRQFEKNQPYRLDDTGGDPSAPERRPVLMFESSFLVPADSQASDEELLKRAVELAEGDELKEYRTAFHAWRRDIVLSGVGESEGTKRLEVAAQAYRKVMRRSKVKVRGRYALGVFAAVAGLAALAFPPVAVAGAAAGLGSATLNTSDPGLDERLRAGAFLHTARRHLR